MVSREFGSQAFKEIVLYFVCNNIGTVEWVKPDYFPRSFPFIYFVVVWFTLVFQPVCIATVVEDLLVRSGSLINNLLV